MVDSITACEERFRSEDSNMIANNRNRLSGFHGSNDILLFFQSKCDLIKGYVRRLNDLRPVVEVLGPEYDDVLN